MDEREEKTRMLVWWRSSKRDLARFPDDVQDEMGHALFIAECGGKYESAKVLRGFGGAGVLEIVEDDASGTYRCVYTVKFSGAVYVLHSFQKKSRKGIETPKEEINVIKQRLREAQEHYEANKNVFEQFKKQAEAHKDSRH